MSDFDDEVKEDMKRYEKMTREERIEEVKRSLNQQWGDGNAGAGPATEGERR